MLCCLIFMMASTLEELGGLSASSLGVPYSARESAASLPGKLQQEEVYYRVAELSACSLGVSYSARESTASLPDMLQ